MIFENKNGARIAINPRNYRIASAVLEPDNGFRSLFVLDGMAYEVKDKATADALLEEFAEAVK